MKRFVFLEFTDPKVRKFVSELRSTLQGTTSTKPVHVTIRGPYKEVPDPNKLASLAEELQGYGIVLGGAGTFKTPVGYSVYLRAQSPVFDRLWWKPDYPKAEFGRNPHITLFETENPREAKSVEVFLRTERIEVFTFSFELSIYRSKQLSLLQSEPPPTIRVGEAILGRWNVRPGILQRAQKLRESFLQE